MSSQLTFSTLETTVDSAYDMVSSRAVVEGSCRVHTILVRLLEEISTLRRELRRDALKLMSC